MALQLSTVAYNGATGDYWRISKLTYDRQLDKTFVDMELWLDAEAAADDTKTSLGNRLHYPLDGEKSRAQSYTEIKAKPEWADSEDC